MSMDIFCKDIFICKMRSSYMGFLCDTINYEAGYKFDKSSELESLISFLCSDDGFFTYDVVFIDRFIKNKKDCLEFLEIFNKSLKVCQIIIPHIWTDNWILPIGENMQKAIYQLIKSIN